MKKTLDDFGSAEPVDVLAILHVVDRGRVPKRTRNLPDGQKPEHQVLPNDRQKGSRTGYWFVPRIPRNFTLADTQLLLSNFNDRIKKLYIYTGNLEEDCSKKLVKDS